MICDATSIEKYIDKSPNIFFTYGPEIILRNNTTDIINNFFKQKNFTERKIITENDFSKIEQIIVENAGGSLFGSKTIIEIIHNGGKIPKEIMGIFDINEIGKFENIVISIRSSIEKINKSTWPNTDEICHAEGKRPRTRAGDNNHGRNYAGAHQMPGQSRCNPC